MRYIREIQTKLFPWVVLVSAASLWSCSRPQLDVSKIRIQIPSDLEMGQEQRRNAEGKLGASDVSAQALTTYSKMCFYVNVRGEGLPSTKPRCEMQRGMLSSPATPGSQIEMSVPMGAARVFEVFGYERADSSESCPIIKDGIPSQALKKFYALGKSQALDLKESEVTVEVTIQLPDQSNNLVAQLSLPADCFGSAGFGTFGGLRPSTFSAAGNQFQIQAQVSSVQGQEIQGQYFRLKARVRAQ